MKQALRTKSCRGLASPSPSRLQYTPTKLPKILGAPSRSNVLILRVLQEGRECSSASVKDMGSLDLSLESVPRNDKGELHSTDTSAFTTDELEGSKEQEMGQDSGSLAGPILGAATLIGVLTLTAIFKEDITANLQAFVNHVEGMGPAGLFAYAGVYILLETLAVPATPLTLTAGYLFGQTQGTLVVICSATVAALLAFLISRYAAREKVAEMAAGNKQFAAIDKAIEKDGFKLVLLLRLSPLLPFAASNYLYGLTSIDTRSYVIASWLGMLPGTWAYVSAGSVGHDILNGGSAGFSPIQIALACGVSAAVIWLAGDIARKALDDLEEEGHEP